VVAGAVIVFVSVNPPPFVASAASSPVALIVQRARPLVAIPKTSEPAKYTPVFVSLAPEIDKADADAPVNRCATYETTAAFVQESRPDPPVTISKLSANAEKIPLFGSPEKDSPGAAADPAEIVTTPLAEIVVNAPVDAVVPPIAPGVVRAVAMRATTTFPVSCPASMDLLVSVCDPVSVATVASIAKVPVVRVNPVPAVYVPPPRPPEKSRLPTYGVIVPVAKCSSSATVPDLSGRVHVRVAVVSGVCKVPLVSDPPNAMYGAESELDIVRFPTVSAPLGADVFSIFPGLVAPSAVVSVTSALTCVCVVGVRASVRRASFPRMVFVAPVPVLVTAAVPSPS